MKRLLTDQFVPCSKNDYKPKFLRAKSVLASAVLLIVLLGILYSFQYVIQRNSDLVAAVVTSVLVDLTNISRSENNVTLLAKSDLLTEAAQQKADHMVREGYFAHESPEGITPWFWFDAVGYDFVYAGENLAVNFVDSEDVVEAWMNSEGHRANILGEQFTEVGIALAEGTHNGKPSVFVVQLFGAPAKQSSAEEVVLITNDTAQESEILGATTEVQVVPLEQTEAIDNFIAVQNTAYTESDIEVAQVAQTVPELNLIEQLVGTPKKNLTYIYIAFGALVLIALILLIVINPRKQYPKYILLGVLLITLTIALLYATNNLVFEEVVVEGTLTQ